MYNDIPFDAENHLVCLWDADLNTRSERYYHWGALLGLISLWDRRRKK
jgi:hypothetical protein